MKYDVIVVGGGHAGIEAAVSASKLVDSVLLVTGNLDYIGEMPCNPAIGGIAKGNIVREIDALGGVMAKLTDRAGIQFRVLNKSKGLAVWGPRAQVDRFEYRKIAREELEKIDNLTLLQDMVEKIIVDNNSISGIETESGLIVDSEAVIITAGTFLNGLAHIGEKKVVCGRRGEIASTTLSESIQTYGIKAGRLKTGTPARIDKDSIDFSQLEVQEGDVEPQPFSYFTTTKLINKATCWSLRSKMETHGIIRANLDKSPLYGLDSVEGVGPRYCPSIEDKVVRFGDRNGHPLFLEPEGLNRKEMYLNGFSTSLPVEVQIKMIQSLSGFENARILKPAYAIEYDYFYPTQLKQTLESRIVNGLYFAGQVNGTSGYEEAAGQGLVAGVNAALKRNGKDPFILGRDQSYIGVLIDDLVTKGTEEPYRMFTSRAEYRLLLRQDNCDERLMPLAYEVGLISEDEFNSRLKVWQQKELAIKKIGEVVVSSDDWQRIYGKPLKENARADKVLKRPEANLSDLISNNIIDLSEFSEDVLLRAEADIKYEGFIKKQEESISKMKKLETLQIPEDIDYNRIDGLLNESREKLISIKPLTVGQASRISGVNPSDISVLLIYLSKMKNNVPRETRR